MTDYTWPSGVYPQNCNVRWLDNSRAFRSPLSKTLRSQTLSGGIWGMSLTIQPRLYGNTTKNDPTIEAFLFSLDGTSNRAVIPDFAYQRVGPGGGSPVVNGAGQTGLSLITSGWPNSTTVLVAGDRIGISSQMIPLRTDATTNGSGQVTLALAHPIRVAPTNGAAIEIDAPTARYALVSQVPVNARPGIIKSIFVEFEEAIP